jgi:hypothetical protein
VLEKHVMMMMMLCGADFDEVAEIERFTMDEAVV